MNTKLLCVTAAIALSAFACSDGANGVDDEEMVCETGHVSIVGCPTVTFCSKGDTSYFVVNGVFFDFISGNWASLTAAGEEAQLYCQKNNLDDDVLEDVVGEDSWNGEIPAEDTNDAPSCYDNILNGTESDVDCGGSCYACADGAICRDPSDCESGSCEDGTCACVPVCECSASKQYECGPDGCGGYCGYGCGSQEDCWNHECKPTACGPVCDQLVAQYGCQYGCEQHGVDDGYGGTTSCYCRGDYCYP